MSILLGFNCKDEHIIELKDSKVLVVHGDIFDIYFTKYKWITNFIIKVYYLIRHYTPFAEDFFRLFKHHTNDFVEKSSDIKQNALNYIDMNAIISIIRYNHQIKKLSYISNVDFFDDNTFTKNKYGYNYNDIYTIDEINIT